MPLCVSCPARCAIPMNAASPNLEHSPKLWQPSSLCLQNLVNHRVNLGQSANGGGQRIQHDGVVHCLDAANQGGLDGKFLHVDVGAVEGGELGGQRPYGCGLDAVAVH